MHRSSSIWHSWQPATSSCSFLTKLNLHRESFLPGSKAGVRSSQQQAAYGPDSVGKYDPILHKWILEPDQEKWQARERAQANQVLLLLVHMIIHLKRHGVTSDGYK